MTPPLALLALIAAAFGVACAVAGAGWMKARSAATWHALLRERELLIDLVDEWLWQTDADLRIQLWRPPAQQADAWSMPAPLGERLFEIAVPAEPLEAPGETPAGPSPSTPLARQMSAHAPLALQKVALRLGGESRAWSIQGRPRFDAQGRFQGYLGTARPEPVADDGGFPAAALDRFLGRAGLCALLFRRAEAAAPYLLHRASPEASALLGRQATDETAMREGGPADSRARRGRGGAPALPWAEACARLPPEVARVVGEAGAGESRPAGDWVVAWDVVPEADDPQAGRLLVLRRNVAAEATPTADAGDHESFIYSVSHDLRAPIRVVEGFARILKEDYGRFLDRIGNDHADRILAATARMNSMMEALLALSRLQSQPLKRQPVDLSQLTRYIVDDLRGQAPDRHVELDIQPGLVVHGDPTLLRVAMENLIGNAWKYSGQVAVARIELRREDIAGQPTIVVADNGAGFDMRFADRLFGVFQRLHSAKDFQGTGVGLASVRRIIRRHGGDIWAESEVGKGARFYFTLPATP